MAQRKKFFGGKKLRALKERSVDALARVGTAEGGGGAQGRRRATGDRHAARRLAQGEAS